VQPHDPDPAYLEERGATWVSSLCEVTHPDFTPRNAGEFPKNEMQARNSGDIRGSQLPIFRAMYTYTYGCVMAKPEDHDKGLHQFITGKSKCTASNGKSIGGGVLLVTVTLLLGLLWVMLMRSAEGIRDLILVCACLFIQVLILQIWTLRWNNCDPWTGWWIAVIGTAILWAWQLRYFVRIRRIVPVYA
jgi:hypothetical protein